MVIKISKKKKKKKLVEKQPEKNKEGVVAK
jgi:hypothetical protein